jgi:hypothetical protein
MKSSHTTKPTPAPTAVRTRLKLQQGQIWKQGGVYFRIVRSERLQVDYKEMTNPNSKRGQHLQASKKEFCRLLKGATLMTAQELFLAPPE